MSITRGGLVSGPTDPDEHDWSDEALADADRDRFRALRRDLYEAQKRIVRIETERDQLKAENQIMREHICDLNNRARHVWSQAVEAATDELFKEMNANPVFRDMRALAAAEGEDT